MLQFLKKSLIKLELALLVSIFLIVGAVGNDPWWKHGETYSFGIIYNFYINHTWLIPMNAGTPFMEKPPLYYWTAALFCRLFDNILSLPDAANLANVFYMAITAIFMWKASKALFKHHAEGSAMSAIAVMLLFGTYGFARYNHFLITDVALISGTTIALYGMALLCTTPENYKTVGFWLGIGLGVAFMTKGLVIPVILGISGIVLWLVLPVLHTYNTSKAILYAIITAAPFLFIWPLWLYMDSSSLFREWFWENNIGRFFGFSVARLGAENRPFFLLYMLPIYAFPIFPLACLHVIKQRADWKRPEHLLPLTLSCIGLFILSVSASGRHPYLLPLMPAFALLAAQSVIGVSAEALVAWNRFVRIAFSICAAVTWLIWWILRQPINDRPWIWLPQLFDKYLAVDFILHSSQPLACTVAIVTALLWLASWRFKGDTPVGTARIWFTGAMLVWCSTYTLLMPWINESMSFRSVITQLNDFIRQSPYADKCIGNFELGEDAAPMVQYFSGKTAPLPLQNWSETTCPLILTFTNKNSPTTVSPMWDIIWKGEKIPHHPDGELRLYKYKATHY